MEDKHSISLTLPSHPNTIVVGVYDGHGGVDVSTFLSVHLPLAINALSDVHDHKAIEEALIELDRQILMKYVPGTREARKGRREDEAKVTKLREPNVLR